MSDYRVNSPEERKRALSGSGAENIGDLFSPLPEKIRTESAGASDTGKSEAEVFSEMNELSESNRVFKHIFRGAGAYKHEIPAALETICSRGEFVTSYTPYQSELSQGTLQLIFEFQTAVCELTGMDAANASVYDGASAAAEAMLMCAGKKKKHFLISSTMNPSVSQTIRTYANSAGFSCEDVGSEDGLISVSDLKSKITEDTAAVFLEQLNYYGLIEDAEAAARAAHEGSAYFVMGFSPVASVLLPTAAECGADIAFGEGQPLGIPLSFGGPYLGLLACREKLIRKLPGRIAGQTTDSRGKKSFVLTLQAREQHIKREKAGSSICSNEALMAARAMVYMALQGPSGMRETAQRCVDNAHYLADLLCRNEGVRLAFDGEFFNEFLLHIESGKAKEIEEDLINKDILPGLVLSDKEMLWCATESNSKEDIELTAEMFRKALLS